MTEESSHEPDAAAAGFLEALTRLPAITAVVFHGLFNVPALSRGAWTAGVTATSLDARIGTENFSTPVIAAILCQTGRDISSFSAHPSEREVVIPPGALLRTLAVRELSEPRATLVVLEQLATIDPTVQLPPTLGEFIDEVTDRIRAAHALPPLPIATPGKFVAPLKLVS